MRIRRTDSARTSEGRLHQLVRRPAAEGVGSARTTVAWECVSSAAPGDCMPYSSRGSAVRESSRALNAWYGTMLEGKRGVGEAVPADMDSESASADTFGGWQRHGTGLNPIQPFWATGCPSPEPCRGPLP